MSTSINGNSDRAFALNRGEVAYKTLELNYLEEKGS